MREQLRRTWLLRCPEDAEIIRNFHTYVKTEQRSTVKRTDITKRETWSSTGRFKTYTHTEVNTEGVRTTPNRRMKELRKDLKLSRNI